MAQFDVFQTPGGGRFPLIMDVQSGTLQQLASRIVVPMMPRKRYTKPISRLNPIATVGGTEYVVVFQELAAIATVQLRDRVTSLAARRADFIAALDLLFTGV